MDLRSGSLISGLGIPTDIFSRLGIGKQQGRYRNSPDNDKTPFSISRFTAEVGRRGMSKPTMYFVEIPDPRSFGGIEQTASMYCCAAEFPSKNIMTTPFGVQAYTIETPYGLTFPDATMEFYVDSEFKVKSFFDGWQDLVFIRNGDTYDVNYRENYVADIKINQLDAETQTVYTVTLFEAFPKTIHPMKLSYQNGNAFHTIAVTFTFATWASKEQEVAARMEAETGKRRGIFGQYIDMVNQGIDKARNFMGSVNNAINSAVDSFKSLF